MKNLLITATAFAMLLAPTAAFAWGAHNPSQVDHPDIPNCTIMDGPNNYANNPNCETVPRGLGSLVGSSGDDCSYVPKLKELIMLPSDCYAEEVVEEVEAE
ncbi:MAG: hypothetical protein ABL879_13370 [Devosia sp.]